MNVGSQQRYESLVVGNKAAQSVGKGQYQTDDQQGGYDDIVEVVVKHAVYLIVILSADTSCTDETGTGTHHADDNKHHAFDGCPHTDYRQGIGRHQMAYDNRVGKPSQLGHQGRYDGRQEERTEHLLHHIFILLYHLTIFLRNTGTSSTGRALRQVSTLCPPRG